MFKLLGIGILTLLTIGHGPRNQEQSSSLSCNTINSAQRCSPVSLCQWRTLESVDAAC